jgi:hypothetical protein
LVIDLEGTAGVEGVEDGFTACMILSDGTSAPDRMYRAGGHAVAGVGGLNRSESGTTSS